ncbi:MAG: thermostable hemolysin [Hydrogenophaga sp.]|uniref:thermostable hemolysin n=1 Tax=Hydrogenophaga sp. TaxID=1904254 RepID=UPI00271DF021|nr:thermostable hemolysin [Hydrogenophaga sp.]MDO9483497.1 thermostable hemolysin [Hydrogenophaga sp.]MDP3343105.1 thermostable hemolysin [Hydrogenophaga sp.]MDP3805346.1 thermostable hemolysin [Hydrogenophaga sp.]MDP3922588.1 thermostable hemolysin [Hydrogenophaga sp.]MDZ4238263.1 thermostable hemolysin [Hydrogenophaga sp.]
MTSSLLRHEAPDGPPPLAGGRGLQVHGVDDPARSEVQAFIARIYAQRFGARVQQFTPCLVSLRDPLSGELVAAAGYRFADTGPLFLERYLSAPIEDLLGAQHGTPVTRRGVVEVGHLAADRAGEGRRLILLLGQHLAQLPEQRSTEWVVSTLTQELRHLFVRLGVTPLALGQADPAAVGTDLAAWGRYYEHRPVVLAGRLQAALRLMGRRATQANATANAA